MTGYAKYWLSCFFGLIAGGLVAGFIASNAIDDDLWLVGVIITLTGCVVGSLGMWWVAIRQGWDVDD